MGHKHSKPTITISGYIVSNKYIFAKGRCEYIHDLFKYKRVPPGYFDIHDYLKHIFARSKYILMFMTFENILTQATAHIFMIKIVITH